MCVRFTLFKMMAWVQLQAASCWVWGEVSPSTIYLSAGVNLPLSPVILS